jgi:uncharacterized protein YjbI with pentapeptide repeats
MKSYFQHSRILDEAKSVGRFLKSNKNLTDDQKDTIIKFFATNHQASRDFVKNYGNWGTKKLDDLTWDDYEKFMLSTKSGFKMLLKVSIPGKKGTDYWPVRVKQKGFVANIPLNHKTAQFMNTCEYGFLHVNYCIGWDMSNAYWHRHVIRQQKVPVYIINGVSKWVVMILPDNKTYEVWDKFNKEDSARKKSEPIPGFSIKKNLITPSLAKVYDEIRTEFYEGETNKNKLLSRFSSNRNDIEIDEYRTANNFDDMMQENWFYNCNISISKDFVNIDGGKVKEANLHDTMFAISIVDSNIIHSNIDIGEYDSSAIRNCKIDLFSIIKNTEIINITGIKSTFFRCTIDDSDFVSTSFTDCDISGGTLKDCNFQNSEISIDSITGAIRAKDTHIYDAVVKDDGYFELCEFHGASLFKGTYRNCKFDADTYVGEDCKIL